MPTARLLSPPCNYAVVQLPERSYPGVVVQGDSLNAIVENLRELHARACPTSDEELIEGLAELLGILGGARDHFEQVCREQGLGLPYSRRV